MKFHFISMRFDSINLLLFLYVLIVHLCDCAANSRIYKRGNVLSLDKKAQCRRFLESAYNSMSEDEKNEICKKYVDLRELGEGGGSYVYKAADLTNNRTVALKFLKVRKCTQCVYEDELNKDPTEPITILYMEHCLDEKHTIPAEMYALQKLDGLNGRVPRFYDYIKARSADTDVIAMSYIEHDDTLNDYIHKTKELPEFEIQSIIKKLISIMVDMMNKNVVHMDLHASNILLRKSEVYVIDFNIIDIGDMHTYKEIPTLWKGKFQYLGIETWTVMMYPPEVFYKDVKQYNSYFNTYQPSKYASFQIGANAYRMRANIYGMTWREMINIYRQEQELIFTRNVTTSVDYRDFLRVSMNMNDTLRQSIYVLQNHSFIEHILSVSTDNETSTNSQYDELD